MSGIDQSQWLPDIPLTQHVIYASPEVDIPLIAPMVSLKKMWGRQFANAILLSFQPASLWESGKVITFLGSLTKISTIQLELISK